jgi:hypothetical protein
LLYQSTYKKVSWLINQVVNSVWHCCWLFYNFFVTRVICYAVFTNVFQWHKRWLKYIIMFHVLYCYAQSPRRCSVKCVCAGIYSSTECLPNAVTNHAVLVVGYDSDAGIVIRFVFYLFNNLRSSSSIK